MKVNQKIRTENETKVVLSLREFAQVILGSKLNNGGFILEKITYRIDDDQGKEITIDRNEKSALKSKALIEFDFRSVLEESKSPSDFTPSDFIIKDVFEEVVD